jgi:purine-binding chemotaxis protein CheW
LGTADSHFNFDQARQQLEALQRALTQSSQLSPEQSTKLLGERAAAYAQAPDRDFLASEQMELLTFQLADERYAIESRLVLEVVKSPAITDVPGTPPLLCGVTNLRGEILPVMDLGQLLGLPHKVTEYPWVLVLGTDRPDLGVVAESVYEVTTVRTDAVLPLAHASQEISRDWIRGVTADGIIVLEGQNVLQDPRLNINQAEA